MLISRFLAANARRAFQKKARGAGFLKRELPQGKGLVDLMRAIQSV